MGDVPAPQPLDGARVLAKSITVLGTLRSACSLEEEFGVDPGVTTTKPEYTEVSIRQRIRRGKAPAAPRPCSGGAHSFYASVTE